MEHTFYRINQTKGAFRDARQTDTMIRAGKLGHFNFSKWHVISHYLKWIKYYRSATGFTTVIGEAIYITWIKHFFKRTNMNKSYEKQILDHNVKKFSLMLIDDIDMFFSTETLAEIDKNTALQVNSVSGAKSITEDLKWHIAKDKYIRLRYSRLSSNYWYLIETVVDKIGVSGLIDILAVFIKQKRAKAKGEENVFNKCQKEDDLSWARKYPI